MPALADDGDDELDAEHGVDKLAAAQTVMKRCCYSESGQKAYVAYLLFGLVLSCMILAFDLIRSARASKGMGREHIQVKALPPLLWMQVVEGYLDVSLIIEVVAFAWIGRGNGSGKGGLKTEDLFVLFDVLVIVWCCATFYLDITHPNGLANDDSWSSTAMFVSRQAFRLVRVVYFFLYFSRTYVEFEQERARSKSPSSIWRFQPIDDETTADSEQGLRDPSPPPLAGEAPEDDGGDLSFSFVEGDGDEGSLNEPSFQFDSSNPGDTVDSIIAAARKGHGEEAPR